MTVRRYIFDKNYDSELGYPNEYNQTEFKLVVKVFLSRINPDDGFFDHVDGVDIRRWGATEWATYKQDLKSDIEKYLNYPQMTLGLQPWPRLNDKMSHIQYLWFVGKQRRQVPAYVRCGVRIELVDDKSKAHVHFRVMRQSDGGSDFTSFTSDDRHSGELTNRDVDRGTTNGGRQNSVSHELGHVLGLGHSNANDPACKKTGDENARICYGKPGTPEYNNLMGWGNQVTVANAAPWLNRMRAHAYGLNWWTTTDWEIQIKVHF